MFTNRDSSWSNDPEYKRARAELKARAEALGLSCARCHGFIDYAGPYRVTVGGRLRVNPRAFVAGHVIDRASGHVDHTLLQPECAWCSIKSGARAGRAKQGPVRASRPVTADLW